MSVRSIQLSPLERQHRDFVDRVDAARTALGAVKDLIGSARDLHAVDANGLCELLSLIEVSLSRRGIT